MKSATFLLGVIVLAAFESTAALGSEPFALGKAVNDLRWELRFNFPKCRHEGRARDAWCQREDIRSAANDAGVEEKLIAWASHDKTRSIQMAYFSFSNQPVREALCEAAERSVAVTLYIDQSNEKHRNVQALDDCEGFVGAAENTTIVAKGKGPFASRGAYLLHIKIFLASESRSPVPLSSIDNEADYEFALASRTRFTSSSANLSTYGTSLHFENWIFFNAPTDDYLAQANLCIFSALAATGRNARSEFAAKYAACRNQIESPPRDDFELFVTPHDSLSPKMADGLSRILVEAEEELLVAAHRFTTSKFYNPLIERISSGVDVSVVFDDDILRTGVVDGGPVLSVGIWDVKAERALRNAGARLSYMETRPNQLHHNKFIVADRKLVLQGAPNFTAAAFNLYGLGHYENLYLIGDKKIIRAYRAAWQRLDKLATSRPDHPVGDHADRPLSDFSRSGRKARSSPSDATVAYLNMPGTEDLGLPFSAAVRVENILYVSGNVGNIPGTLDLASGGIQGETRQTLDNIKAVLEQFGSSMDKVVKCTVFLADIGEWGAMNEVYRTYFKNPPARSALGANGLALGARVEIECIATM